MRKTQPMAGIEHRGIAIVMWIFDEYLVDDKRVGELGRILIQELKTNRSDWILIDFSEVRGISTALLGYLLRLQKRLFSKGIRLRLCCLDADKLVTSENDRYAYEIFRVIGLSRLFDLSRSRAEDEFAALLARIAGRNADSGCFRAAMAC
jgi:anti-anti-sigma regulatory factor